MEPHGRRLTPKTIDHMAEKDPNRAWASIARQDGSQFEDISMAAFANAINRIAHWIVEVVGPASKDGKKTVLAYVGPSDLRYYVVPVAMMKAGYAPLFMSHLNSKADNTSLMLATECKGVLCGSASLDISSIDADQFKVFITPDYDAVWDPTPAPLFPFTKSFDDAFDDPIMILHTSGSTGRPKPITWTHGAWAALDTREHIPDFEGFESDARVRATMTRHFIGLPLFHGSGFASGIEYSIFSGVTIVFPLADRPVDSQALINAIDHGRIDSAALLPHILEEVARTPEALKRLHKLRQIRWTGGAISQQAGDAISAHATLVNSYGSTEMGVANCLIKKDPSLWQWIFLHPHANAFGFRPVAGQDNLFELFVVRDPSQPQFVFRLFPHLDEWPMRDLFIKHPTLPHHWLLVGRSDNLIVLHDGSKLNPTSYEDAVRRTPGVRDAIVFGNSRTRPGILVEPVEPMLDQSGDDEKSRFLDEVFASLETINRDAPKRGIVLRELLLLTNPTKPFPRSGKQMVQRGTALKMYTEEIDALYEGSSHF